MVFTLVEMLVIEVLHVLEAFRAVLCLAWVGFKEQASTSLASMGTAASCSCCLRKNQGAFTLVRAPKAGFAAMKGGGLMFQGRAQAPEMGSEGAKPALCPGRWECYGYTPQTLSQPQAQPRAKALLLEMVPAPTEAHGESPTGFCCAWERAGSARAFLSAGSRAAAPAARDAGELLPHPAPLLPTPPAPTAFVSVQMFVFSATGENIHYLVSCCSGGSSDLHFHS